MKFYIFNSDFNAIDSLEESGFAGNLFVYNTNNSDPFTKIAKTIDEKKNIKYMVAIRPHVISPEYLVMIDKSIKEFSKRKRLQLNLISGHIKDDEKDIIRTVGPVSNKSTNIERSQYLIEYVELLNSIPIEDRPDFYISVTNDFTFDIGAKYNNKMIIPYSTYLSNSYDLKNKKIMISITPILRKTQKEIDNLGKYEVRHQADLQAFTYDQMSDLVYKLTNQGINEMIFSAWNDEDMKEIIKFVKAYHIEKRWK